jgi:preprotein translocase subunit SecG
MIYYYLITTLHVIVCIILVLVVLLQSGKGADLAGAFGGGATQTAFGSRGPASFLSKMTTGAAIIFMLTSISLSMITTRSESKSILENKKHTAQPFKKAATTSRPSKAAKTPDQIQRELDDLKKNQEKNQAAPAAAPAPGNSQQQAAPDNKAGKK